MPLTVKRNRRPPVWAPRPKGKPRDLASQPADPSLATNGGGYVHCVRFVTERLSEHTDAIAPVADVLYQYGEWIVRDHESNGMSGHPTVEQYDAWLAVKYPRRSWNDNVGQRIHGLAPRYTRPATVRPDRRHGGAARDAWATRDAS